jgi:diadenosine tetraphosphate (Ap4A) HIT family hydrolase
MEGCLACDLAEGREPLPGGVIAETDGWIVEHCVGPLGVGTLIVKPRRHVVHVADLDAGEAAGLGPLLRQAAALVTALVEPEQVYVCLWSHHRGVPGHIHFVVQPVRREQKEALGTVGPGLQVAMFEAAEAPDPEAVAEFADRAREWLAASG